jgi:hypothetical protein
MNSITPSETVARISMVRNRNEVLKHILPKIFGIISERGQWLEAYPGCSASLDGGLTLSGGHLGADRIALSAYSPLKSQITKVFSAHVMDLPSSGYPNFYRVGVQSWRRGPWEDAVMADAATPLSLSETFLRGVFRTGNQLLRH